MRLAAMSAEHDAYFRAFRTLAEATDQLQLALAAWYRARAAAEAAWEKTPPDSRKVLYEPKDLAPGRDPAIRGIVKPPSVLGVPAVNAAGAESTRSADPEELPSTHQAFPLAPCATG
jgi:hypothetical protein